MIAQSSYKKRVLLYSSALCFSITLMRPGLSLVHATSNNRSAEQVVAESYSQLRALYAKRGTLAEEAFRAEVNQIITALFDIQRLAPQLLPNHWSSLDLHSRTEFEKALVVSIGKKIDLLLPGLSVGFPELVVTTTEVRDNFTRLNYSINRDKQLSVFLLKKPDSGWQISNVKTGKKSLRQTYYQSCKKLIDKYSFRYLIGEMIDAGYIVLEDFEATASGDLPNGWTWKSKDDEKNKPYEVVADDSGNHYLAARDQGESVIMGKDIKWNIKKYPYISFRWRGLRLPEGGDERFNRSVDSAAGVYFVYKKKLGLIPVSVKFVWSTTLPVGAAMQRSGVGRPWMVIAESGEDNLGQWHTYTFNLYEAYKKTFGGTPPDKPIGVGVLSDANSTKSSAHADYDDIRALKNANADAGVTQIMDAE